MMHSEDTPLDARIAALLRITTAIETATTMDELLLLSLSEIADLIDVQHTIMALLRDDGSFFQIVNTFPPRVSLPPPMPIAETVYLKQVAETRRPVQMYDLQAADVHPAMASIIADDSLRSMLMMPLVAQDRVIGVLGLAALYEPRQFSDLEIATIRVLTGPLAASIAAFHVTEAARRRSAELATLNDIATAVTSSLDTHVVYLQVVRQLNEYFRVDAGSLLMRDEDTGDLEFVMTLEAGEEKLAGVRVPRGQGVVGHVAETQQFEIVLDAQNDPRFYRKVSEDVGYVTRSILCVPMVVKGRTIGVIELLNKYDGPFTDEDAERLQRMAATVGVAIENARLFQQVTTGRDRFEAILNSTNDGILMVDMHDFIVTANPSAAGIFQVADDAQLLGKPIEPLLNDLRQRAQEVSSPSWLNDGDNSLSEVVEFELAEGQTHFWRHFWLPVYDQKEEMIGKLLMFQDISKERELAQLRDDYTGMLVHDLRAPLTAIMNGIMMVRRGLGGPVSEQQQELLGIAYQSSQTMLEMVNTLLDIAKMEQGRLPLDISPLSPYALFDEALDRLRASAQDNNVELVPQLPIGLPLLEADHDKLIRILQNLLDNAIKFSPARSQIILGFAHAAVDAAGWRWKEHPGAAGEGPQTFPLLSENDWMVLWITDHGSGIPKQYHERIFEKFGQVRGKKVRGTGLGLTFCKLAVESHGGHIWVESEEGKGSTFALALPMTHEETR